jgi:hypothetical protein
MGARLGIAAAVTVLTLLNYFQFPGHTYLQADTQIYVPILEHIWDPAALPSDPIVLRPHVSFTIYDELAESLRKFTGQGFRQVLAGEQIFFRALGIWGLYLIASSAGLSTPLSLLVTAILSLGATIGGPSVLSFEYEPTPRGFAVPLLFLAIGLIAHGRILSGAIAGSVAFLLHAPTVYPFWAVYLVLALLPSPTRSRKLWAFAPLLAAGAVLWISSLAQGGGQQMVTFFSRLDPAQETLQRFRASYVWISIWAGQWLPHYIFLYAATVIAVARLSKALTPELRAFAIGLPLIAILSMPFSYLTLEKMQLALMPQLQPLRALLFLTVMAELLAAIAACIAVRRNRYWEAALWLVLAYLIPVNTDTMQWPAPNRIAVALILVALALGAIWADTQHRSWAAPLTALVAISSFFIIPIYGKVVNYAPLHSAALDELNTWARSATPKSAVFLFPEAKRELYPGVFRAEALRTVYVDWKAGGQVNYFKDFGEMWWSRWQDVMVKPFTEADCPRFAALGIDYIVLTTGHKLPDRDPEFENASYVAYAIRNQ